MDLNFGKLFPRGKKKPATITTPRAMSMRVDGETRHVPAGETVTIDRDVFEQLDVSDFTLKSLNEPKLQAVDPTPPRPEPEPMPAGWEELPKCFREFHDLEQSLLTADRHLTLIREKRREIFGSGIDFAKGEGRMLVGNLSISADQRDRNLYPQVREINFDDPEQQAVARYLSRSEKAAMAHLQEARLAVDLPMQRAFLACGAARLQAAESLQSLAAELAEIAFSIFAARIESLGLGESKIRSLFVGSADFLKYANHSFGVGITGMRFGGYDDDGITVRVYSDLPVSSSASHLRNDLSHLASLKPILVAAKKELARTLTANLPSGLPS